MASEQTANPNPTEVAMVAQYRDVITYAFIDVYGRVLFYREWPTTDLYLGRTLMLSQQWTAKGYR